MAISVVKLLELIKPHNIGDKIYYINRYGVVRRATIVDIRLSGNLYLNPRAVAILKIRGSEEPYGVELGACVPNRIYANRDRAKRHAPEVIKYFQEN